MEIPTLFRRFPEHVSNESRMKPKKISLHFKKNLAAFFEMQRDFF